VQKGTYTAVIYSLAIHSLILFIILVTAKTQQLTVPEIEKTVIKSFLYYAPKSTPQVLVSTTENSQTEKENDPIIAEPTLSPKDNQAVASMDVQAAENIPEKIEKTLPDKDDSVVTTAIDLPKATATMPQPSPEPDPTKRKLDSFTQLQRLRNKLKQSSSTSTRNPNQNYQPASIFNNKIKSVPHSAPVKDEEQERAKNTKDLGAGIAITKGDDGTCSVTQDMTAYGLSEGSSTQYFTCGESNFDKSFREHMKKVKAKLGKTK
jgi:hypothetical protein